MSEVIYFDPQEENLDNTIKLVEPGVYLADNGKVSSEFYQAENEVVFVNNNRRISWTPTDMRYIDEIGLVDPIYNVQEVPLETKGNYARYNRAMPDVDDWFIQENDRLKHQILIQGFQPDPSPWMFGKIDFAIGGKMKFDADLKIIADEKEQLSAFETHGGIQILDGDKVIFELPQIVAFDSAFDRALTYGKYRVWFNDNAEMMFDIIVDYDWISSLNRVYPIVIDPTIIVSGGYTTNGHNGKRMTELSNGAYVTVISNSASTTSAYIFKSLDKGLTWTQSCFISNANGASIASKDNTVYVTFNDSTSVYCVAVDISTVQNIDVNSTKKIIHSNVIDFSVVADSGTSLVFNPTSNKLVVGYTGKDPGGGKVYIATSLDGITWTIEASSLGKTPSLLIDSMGNIGYFLAYSGRILYFSKSITGQPYSQLSSTGWGHSIVHYDPYNSSYYPSGVKSDNGHLHVIFSKSANNKHALSTNNGVNWTLSNLDAGNVSYGAIEKRGNKLFAYTNRNLYTYENGTWTFSADIGEPFNYPNAFSGSNFIGLLYTRTDNTAVKFEKITFNEPPSAPYNLSIKSFDSSDGGALTWLYSDPDPTDKQTAYQVQIKDSNTGSVALDTGKVASAISSRSIAPNALPNGKQFQIRVKTWDTSDAEGAWSEYITFYTSAKPTVTISSITDGQIFSGSAITLEWLMSDPESEGQGAYQTKLTNMSDVVLFDTGKVVDSRSRARTIPYTLINNTSYKVKQTVWDTKDVMSVEVVKTFTVKYTAPTVASLNTTKDNKRGSIFVEVVNESNVATVQNPIVANFVGKVSGSTVENPHGSYYTHSTTMPSVTVGTEIGLSGTSYLQLQALDGNLMRAGTSSNGVSAFQRFSYNLIEEYKRKIGLTLSVQQVKEVTKKLTANWHGFGSSPTGYNAKLSVWDVAGNTWFLITNHLQSVVTKQVVSRSNPSNHIDANGIFHLLANADPSNGTVASTINTDYVELYTEFDHKKLMSTLPKVISNEVFRRIIGENEWKRIGYVSPRLYGKNLLPPFTEWTLHANATVKSAYEFEHNISGTGQVTTLVIPVKKGVTYTFSNGIGDFYGRKETSSGAVVFTPTQRTFTPDSDFNLYIYSYNGTGTSGTATFTNPQLKIGSTATAFEPQKFGGIFTDFTPISEKLYEYKVKSIGDNAVAVESASINDSVAINDAQLSLVSDFSKWAELKYNGQRSVKTNFQSVQSEFAGRKRPVTEYGELETNNLDINYLVEKGEIETLKEILTKKEPLLYRDSRGRRHYVTIGNFNIADELEFDQDYSVSLPLVEIDYLEGV